MEKVLKLYKYINGTTSEAFPSEKEQVIVSSFRYDAKRMGGAPTISCSVMHSSCLDNLWTDNVYASFNGEKYFIKQVPTSSYGNSDTRYKYDIELVSERILLDNVYFYDVVSSSSSDRPVSHSSDFSFFGTISEFASRLNQSLRYSKLDYNVVVDSGISSEPKLVTFQDQFFSNVLQEIFNTYQLPYYFTGKTIHIGYTNNAITKTLKYGQSESLLSIQKQNANYKIVNRVTGVGSPDNIPYYYPNDYESKSEVEASGGTWINPQRNLMPSIYRDTYGCERFYSAKNNTYISPQTGDYYVFDNPYTGNNPKEHIVNFENIKPTIEGIKNGSGYRIDMFREFAYDLDDNDETDEEGNYKHPYFFAKLRHFDGEFGFNLFDHAIDEEEMVISMTSGSCGACEFIIGVDENSNKNIVQVDENGNLLRDDNGNVKFGAPQDRQNDTVNNEVWIALKKDIDTFGVIMPNASSNYKPSVNDTFVILHIDLPKSYIIAAEKRLDDELIKYMAMNNDEKFNFSIEFSRIFFAENPSILDQLNENARIQIEYDDNRYELYVSSFSYAMNDNAPLPEVRVELSDTLTISQNALQSAIDEVKQDIMSSVGSVDFLKQGLRYFLRKDRDDRSRGLIASDKGFEVGKFQEGVLGTGAAMYQNAEKATFVETDFLIVRKKAFFTNITVQELKHVGGVVILSPAAMVCSKVEETTTGWKCYFNTKDADGRRVYNEFEVGDQARCQTFNLEQQADGMMGNRYYWRLVKEVGEDFIVLSKTDYDKSVPNDIPQEGDNICQLGNRNDSLRQNAIIISAYGTDAPSFKQYKGIKSYNMAEAELVTKLSPFGNEIKGKFISEDGTDIKDEMDGLKVDWDKVLEQTDKEFTIWYFDYAPTLSNKPAVEWTTDELKELHEEDLFYDTKTGFAYRFERVLKEVDGLYQYVYQWSMVSDSETIKALQASAKAQDTADGKRRVFVAQPTPPYDAGDQWVNATYGELFDDDDLVCTTPKAEGEEFSIADWRPVSYGRTSVIKNMEGEIQLIANAFELGADGNLYLKNEAGMKITAEMAQIYATQTSLDLLGNKVNDLSSDIDVTAEKINLFTQKFSFDSYGNVTNINTSGLVTTSDFSTMFAQSVVDNNLVARAELSVFVKTDLNGNVSSGVYINADNVRINGITDIGSNKVSIGGFTINSDYMQAGVSTASGIMTLSATTLGFKEDGGMHVLIGPGAFGSAGEVGLYSNAPSGGFSVWGIGGAKMVARETNSEMVLIGGLALTYKFGNSFTYPANSPSGATGAWADFLVMNGNASLPNPSSCPGKVLFVKCKSGSTLSVPNGMDAEGSSKTSWNDGNSRFFISSSSNWHEFYCS